MGLFELGDLPKEMENVVFSLRPYVISPVTESEFGFHIFRVTQKMNKRVMYISKARPIIKNKILSDKFVRAKSFKRSVASAKVSVLLFSS